MAGKVANAATGRCETGSSANKVVVTGGGDVKAGGGMIAKGVKTIVMA